MIIIFFSFLAYLCIEYSIEKFSYSAQHEFRDAPIGVMRLVQYRNANVPVINRMSIHGPVVVTLFPALFNTPC